MKRYILFLSISLIGLSSCDKESLTGSNLLNEDNIEISFTDLLALGLSTNQTDSLRTYASNGFLVSTNNRYSVGTIQDDIFGTTNQELILSPNFITMPDFTDADLDSMVLIIPLDDTGAYGKRDATHKVSVYSLADDIYEYDKEERMDTFYHNQKIEFDETRLIGQVEKSFSYADSLTVYNPSLDSFQKVIPQLRVPIEDIFATQFFLNQNLESDSLFQSIFKGMVITSESAESSFLGLRVLTEGSITEARLRMYYNIGDTTKTFFDYYLNGLKHTYIEHDKSGTDAEIAIQTDNDETLYLQSKAGSQIDIDLSEVLQFAGKGINYAEIEMVINESASGDLELYPPPQKVLAVYRDEDDNLQVVTDIAILGSSSFGGTLQKELDDNGDKVQVYNFRITDHVIKIKNGTIENPVITLLPEQTLENPRRVVFHGNDGSTKGAILKLVVSNP